MFLLDTDDDRNDPADRELTHKPYSGGRELRLRQELILGVGGVPMLRALNLNPDIWHANEGHAGFMFIERLRELIHADVPFAQAVEQIRRRSIFTTHTRVPAGHDAFTAEQIEQGVGPIWDDLGHDRDRFLGLGKDPAAKDSPFT